MGMKITQRRPRGVGSSGDVEGSSTSPDVAIHIEHQTPPAPPFSRKRPPKRAAVSGGGRIDDIIDPLRRFANVIFSDLNDATLQREGATRVDFFAVLLKEVAICTLIAFSIISALLFVSRYFDIHSPFLYKYERAMVHVLWDEGGMKRLEEDSGLVMMPVDEYTSITEEIEQSAAKIKMEGDVLDARTRALEEARKERAEVEIEYPKLFSALELDHFCADCKWGGQSCLARAQYLEGKYHTPKFQSMLSAMERESCRKSAGQLEQDKKNRGLEQKMLADRAWETDFCSDCEYERGTTCYVRANFLGRWYGLGSERARARVMAEAIHCRLSHHKGSAGA